MDINQTLAHIAPNKAPICLLSLGGFIEMPDMLPNDQRSLHLIDLKNALIGQYLGPFTIVDVSGCNRNPHYIDAVYQYLGLVIYAIGPLGGNTVAALDTYQVVLKGITSRMVISTVDNLNQYSQYSTITVTPISQL